MDPDGGDGAVPGVWLGPGGEVEVLTLEGLAGLKGDETIDVGLISPLEAWGKTLGRLVEDLDRWWYVLATSESRE